MKNSILFTISATILLAATATSHAQLFRNPVGVPVQRNYPQQARPYYPQGTPVMQNRGQMSTTTSTEVELPPMSAAQLAKSDLGATFLDAGNSGLRVGSVFAKSPAKSADFRTGDFVTKVNGKAVPSAAQFRAMIGDLKPGTKVKLTHKRGTKERDVEVAVMKMEDIVTASIVAEPGTFDRSIEQTNQQIASLKQKVQNAEQDLKDAQEMLAGQEKRLVDLKAKAEADRKKIEADKAAEKMKK